MTITVRNDLGETFWGMLNNRAKEFTISEVQVVAKPTPGCRYSLQGFDTEVRYKLTHDVEGECYPFVTEEELATQYFKTKAHLLQSL